MANPDEVDKLAQVFHREYCKVFISASWDLAGSEYKRAVLLGIGAVLDNLDGVERSTKVRNTARFKSSDSTN